MTLLSIVNTRSTSTLKELARQRSSDLSLLEISGLAPCSSSMTAVNNKILLIFVMVQLLLPRFIVTAYSVRPYLEGKLKSHESSKSSTMECRMRYLSLAKIPETSAPASMIRSLFRLENLPLVGITVGTIAFSFQLSVLYPWHIELHKDFTALEVN